MSEKSLIRGIRIESDGTATGTKIYTADGTKINGVKSVVFKHAAVGLPIATLEVFVSEAVLTNIGAAVTFFNPSTVSPGPPEE